MSDPTRRAEVTVVVPSHRGEAWLLGCLRSLGEQTLERDRFEVVVVENGQRGGAAGLVERAIGEYPGLRVTHLYSPLASLPAARNLGMEHVTTPYVTFVDDDDRVAPRYLEYLLSAAAPDAVVVAPVLTVREGRFYQTDSDNYWMEGFEEARRNPDSFGALIRAINSPWAKIVRTDLARRVGFDVAARSAEDVVFWLAVFLAEPLRLVVGADPERAAYLYNLRAGSLLQRGAEVSWDFNVERVLGPLAALDTMRAPQEPWGEVLAQARHAVLGPTRPYLAARPQDRPLVEATLTASALSATPWRCTLAGTARRGLLLTDAAATITAEDAFCDGVYLDVCTFADGPVPPGALDAGTLVDRRIHVAGAAPGDWTTLDQQARRILAELIDPLIEGGEHVIVRTVSANPTLHLIAALVTTIRSGLRWQATVLPGGTDIEVEPIGIFDVLAAGLVEAGFRGDTVPERSLGLARLLMAHLAESIEDRDTADAASAAAVPTRQVVVDAVTSTDWLGRTLVALAPLSRHPGGLAVTVESAASAHSDAIIARFRRAHPALDVCAGSPATGGEVVRVPADADLSREQLAALLGDRPADGDTGGSGNGLDRRSAQMAGAGAER